MNKYLGIEYFANPEALWLLLLIPIYIFWYLRFYAPKRLLISLSYDPYSLKRPKLNLAFLRFIPRILQLCAIVSIVIALARPQSATEIIESQTEGIDIMLLLDTSGSMETEDYPPNRLEVAKKTAASFVEGRKHDRIGIVLFAEEALSYSPLTLDYQLLNKLIRSIHQEILPKQGTAIGSAISIGINRMRDSQHPSKVMILMTDGANNRGKIDPITAAKLAKNYHIRVYCIGIGKEVYMRSYPLGGKRSVQSDLDEQSLMQIAAITGGVFFRSTDQQSLDAIFDQIGEMETAEARESVYRELVDHYPKFIQIAIVCLGLSFFSMLSFIYNPLEH